MVNHCSVEITLEYNLLRCSLLSREYMERKTLPAEEFISILYTFLLKCSQYVKIFRPVSKEISYLLWNPNFITVFANTS